MLCHFFLRITARQHGAHLGSNGQYPGFSPSFAALTKTAIMRKRSRQMRMEDFFVIEVIEVQWPRESRITDKRCAKLDDLSDAIFLN